MALVFIPLPMGRLLYVSSSDHLHLKGCSYFCFPRWPLYPGRGLLVGRYRLLGGCLAESRLHHPQQRKGLRFYKQLRQHLESCASSKTLASAVSLFTCESFSSDGTLIISETTPGVFQASGYGDLTATKSIWYVRVPQYSTDQTLMISL